MRKPPLSSRKSRRSHRRSTPNPFPHFRDEKSDDEPETDPVNVVTTYYDGKKRLALALMDDGSVTLADSYSPGHAGFAIARWVIDGKSHGLELITNDCVHGDRLVIPEEKTNTPKPKSKPKAKGRSAPISNTNTK